MNRHQQHLFSLLKEIDAFCRKHDITYYCAGGTVIGAARHGGFIPWDDDIDIYMTRAEFRKFVKAFEEDPIPERCIEYYEKEHEHHSVINRYHETCSTMMNHYHITGHACAGTLIDVFILDPVPDDDRERKEYIAKFWVLSDLVSPALSYAHRLPAEYLGLYTEYEKRIEKEGIPALVRELSDEIFAYDEKDCSDYLLRWGSMVLVYPIDAIGRPVYLPFEDMMIPVPQDWYRYLVVHYGCEWVQIPYVENRREHVSILRDDVPYTRFYELRDEMFSQDELMKLHFDRKHEHIRMSEAERPLEAWTVAQRSRICRAAIDRDPDAARGTEAVRRLYDSGEYERIIDIYRPYIAQQSQMPFMGKRMHHGWQYRWIFPAYIELDDSELDMLFSSLLYTGKTSLCEKLTGIYIRGGRDSAAARGARALIDKMNLAAAHYYRGEYEECLAVIDTVDEAESYPWFNDFRWMASAALGLDEEAALGLEKLYREAYDGQLPAGCSRDAVMKARADHLWRSGKKDEASEAYRKLMETSRNGMFHQEIKAKGVDIPEIPLEKPSSYRPDSSTARQDEMILEIVDICERNGMDYRLGEELGARLKCAGDPGYNYNNREILMDASSAEAFLSIAERELPPERRLYSWLNDARVNDFSLIYADSSSMYCDFTNLERWTGTGLFVTIRIMRRSGAAKSYRNKVRSTENAVNLVRTAEIDKNRIAGRKRKLLYAFLRVSMSERKRQKKCRELFGRSMKTEAEAGGDRYYYENRPGFRPKIHKISKADWDKGLTADWEGRSVSVLGSAEDRSKANDELNEVVLKDSIFIYRDTALSWSEASDLIDRKDYEGLDFREYGNRRKVARKLDRRVEGIWEQMLETENKI